MKYFYIDDILKQQCGPFELKDLANRNIRHETMVWTSGMADWVPAGNVQDLAFLFDSRIPVPDRRQDPPRRQIDINKPEQSRASETTPQPDGKQQYNPDINRQGQNRWDDILPIPKSWLVESIILSIFCCSPISVVGIFYASRVESLYYAKDYEGATRASSCAKNWTLAGILFLPVCYILLAMLGLMANVFI